MLQLAKDVIMRQAVIASRTDSHFQKLLTFDCSNVIIATFMYNESVNCTIVVDDVNCVV